MDYVVSNQEYQDNRRQTEHHLSLLKDGRGANRRSSERRVKLVSTIPSRDRGRKMSRRKTIVK